MVINNTNYINAELEAIALKVREHIVRMSTDGGCFTGASLSSVDVVVYLYAKFLNVNAYNLDDPNRDYFFLSKGHDVPALYGTLAELGIIQKERLAKHLYRWQKMEFMGKIKSYINN